jgi:enoyl-[acyl-carrier protein] reductase III
MEIEAIGRRCLVVRANLGEPRQVEGLVAEAASFAAHGIYAFVHCAAIGVFKPVLGVRPSQFDLSMSVNARSFLDAARCLRSVMTPGDARMIAISGQGARAVVREYGPVGVSKAALESLVRYLAVELAPNGIRVNALSSGLIDTDAVRSFPDAAERLDRVARDTPLGRLGQPEDIANVVALLCSPDAAWITGQVVVADGGYGLLAGSV